MIKCLRCFCFFVLLACSTKDKSTLPKEIKIEVNATNQYFVNDNLVVDGRLKEVLVGEKEKLIKTHHQKENEITIILKVDKAAKRWILSDLEAILRQLNLRTIEYTPTRPRL